MGKLYQILGTINSLKAYFIPYLTLVSKPTGEKLWHMILAIFALPVLQSIRFSHKWFLNRISTKSINSFYHLFDYTKLPLEKFMRVTVNLALSCIPLELKNEPIFLVIDDTLQSKYGTHFDCVSKLFDHAKHNGSNYLNGHAFVALVIRIPVFQKGKIVYLAVPVGYFMKKEKEESKLKLGSNLIDLAMDEISSKNSTSTVYLLCDSWYPKGSILETVKSYSNLQLIANVRKDTALYELVPSLTGKRGRPRKRGQKLNIMTDFEFTKLDHTYFVATRMVKTNLFDDAVFITITATTLENEKSYRIFLCTQDPKQISMNTEHNQEEKIHVKNTKNHQLLPYQLYGFRWAIEVVFYEQKTFWSFGKYMLRKQSGMMTYVNLLSISYACVQLLPYINDSFHFLIEESSQGRKNILGNAISKELFLSSFVSKFEDTVNYELIVEMYAEECSISSCG